MMRLVMVKHRNVADTCVGLIQAGCSIMFELLAGIWIPCRAAVRAPSLSLVIPNCMLRAHGMHHCTHEEM